MDTVFWPDVRLFAAVFRRVCLSDIETSSALTAVTPSFFKMSDEKQQSESPTVVIAETTPPSKSRNTKKYVVIAVGAISAAAIILTAILVGMYMFTEAQKEIIKYTLKFGENMKQEVTSDPNENVVEYHVSNPGQESWIVNDFNKDIQVVKIKTGESTDCYVNALNRSSATDPSKIAKPQSEDKSDNLKGSTSLGYTTSGTPISDTSFLSKKARDMCKGVSIYWVYPVCLDKSNAQENGTDVMPRSKRYVDYSPYYVTYPYNGYGCVKMCCMYVCAPIVRYIVSVEKGIIYCTWYSYNYAGWSAPPVYYGCTNGPRGLRCPNRYPARWNVC